MRGDSRVAERWVDVFFFLAPVMNETLEVLRDPRRRPPRAREPIPIHLMDHVLDAPFALDEDTFAKNVRSARKGAAPGPLGMTVEHLRPLLDNPRDVRALFLMAEQLAQGMAPEAAVRALRLGRLTPEEAHRRSEGHCCWRHSLKTCVTHNRSAAQ